MKQVFVSIKGKFVPIAATGAGLLALLAAGAYASHSWGGYHWERTANPFVLNLGDNLSSAWDPYLAGASSDWNGSSVLDATIVAGTALRHRSPNLDCSPVSGTIQVCNKTYGKTGWLGLASIWASGSHITKATAKMNDTYFNTATYNTPAWKRLVVCQEIAHGFGLDHQDEIFNNPNLGTCMDYTNDPDGGPGGASETDLTNEHPNVHDYEQLDATYEHLDSSTTTQSQSLPSSAASDEPGNSEWGKAIRTSSDGHTSLYERDLGNGQKVFTFVFWADRGAK